jgi:cytochrome c-type biogenesis protein CcmH/NrfF
MKNRTIITFLACMVLIILLSACSSATSSPQPASTTPPDGATLLQERCTVCHQLSFVERSRHTAADWKLIVDSMISRGAKLTPEEETLVVDYLSANYGQ